MQLLNFKIENWIHINFSRHSFPLQLYFSYFYSFLLIFFLSCFVSYNDFLFFLYINSLLSRFNSQVYLHFASFDFNVYIKRCQDIFSLRQESKKAKIYNMVYDTQQPRSYCFSYNQQRWNISLLQPRRILQEFTTSSLKISYSF